MNIEDLFSLLCTLVTEFWQDLDGGSEDRRRNIIHNATKLIVVDIFAFHDSSSLMLQTLSSWYQPSQRVEAKPYMSGPVSHPQPHSSRLLCGRTNIKVFKRLVFICSF